MKAPVFLTLADVLGIHKDQISLYGGLSGIRDLGLLSSAMAQPEATFGESFLHGNIFEMASAYAYHIVLNHPFLDGNKRAALATALVFLEINGTPVLDPDQKLLEAMLEMASGKFKKKDFSQVLRQLAQPKNH